MQLPRISVLYGNWIEDSVFGLLFPLLSGLSKFEELLLPFDRLDDEDFWRTIGHAQNKTASNKYLIGRLDFRHWAHSDEDFDRYLKKVTSIYFPSYAPSDCPFDYESPAQTIQSFSQKVYARTRRAAEVIRQRQPDSLILSPSICLSREMDRYLEFFVHNRNYYDVYSLHCCNDGGDESTSALGTFLRRVLSVLRKPVWATRWGLSSCDGPITSSKTMAISSWRPVSLHEAAARYQHSFRMVEDIAQNDVRWFITNLCLDEFSPLVNPSNAPKYRHYMNVHDSNEWSWQHFTGLASFNKVPKLVILKKLADIARSLGT